jgi:hypothetical protein
MKSIKHVTILTHSGEIMRIAIVGKDGVIEITQDDVLSRYPVITIRTKSGTMQYNNFPNIIHNGTSEK